MNKENIISYCRIILEVFEFRFLNKRGRTVAKQYLIITTSHFESTKYDIALFLLLFMHIVCRG